MLMGPKSPFAAEQGIESGSPFYATLALFIHCMSVDTLENPDRKVVWRKLYKHLLCDQGVKSLIGIIHIYYQMREGCEACQPIQKTFPKHSYQVGFIDCLFQLWCWEVSWEVSVS